MSDQVDSKKSLDLAAKIIENLNGVDPEIGAKALVVALAWAIDVHWRQDAKEDLVKQCNELLYEIVFDRCLPIERF